MVEDFLNSVGGYRYKARRDLLLEILDVDLDWHMHAISDGERRRVQLVMGLMADWDVLLLDEVKYNYLTAGISKRINATSHRSPLTLTFLSEMICSNFSRRIARSAERQYFVCGVDLLLLPVRR